MIEMSLSGEEVIISLWDVEELWGIGKLFVENMKTSQLGKGSCHEVGIIPGVGQGHRVTDKLTD